MPSKATIVLVGHLARAPEISRTQAGGEMATFSIPVNDGKRWGASEWQEHTSWYRCRAFGMAARIINERGDKGVLVQVTGKLTTGLYVPPQEGREPRVNLEVDVDSVLVLERASTPLETASTARVTADDLADDLESLPF